MNQENILKKLYLIYFLIISLLSTENSFGQVINSAQNTIDSLNNLARINSFINFTTARRTAQKAKLLSLKINYLEGQIESNYILCNLSATPINNKNLFQELNDLLNDSKINTKKENIGKIYGSIAACYYFIGNFDSSIYYNQKGIEYLKKSAPFYHYFFSNYYLSKSLIKSGDLKSAGIFTSRILEWSRLNRTTEYTAWANDLSGEIYHSQRLYSKAIEKYKIADSLFTKFKVKQGKASALMHQGNSYYMLMQDDSAEKCYKASLQLYIQVNDSFGTANCYSNLSRLELEKKNYSQSVLYANTALVISEQSGFLQITDNTLQQLGDIYLEQENYSQALIVVKQALKQAQDNQHRITELDSYKSLSEIYSALNNNALAYNYLLISYRLKDSLQPLVYSKKLAEIQVKYLDEKKQDKITLLEKNSVIQKLEIKQQNNQLNKRNIFIGTGLLLFVFIGSLVYNFNHKQKLRNDLEKQLAIKVTEESERLRFAKDIHDDLGAGLSKINYLSEQLLTKPNSLNAANIAQTAKDLVANMHDLIWALNPENTTLDNLLASIREYCADYLDDFPITYKFNLPLVFDDFEIKKEVHREIFMTVKEIINNVVKHSKAATVEITANISSQLFTIEINDNGIGFNTVVVKTGNGLRNMKNRIELIGGICSINCPKLGGTSIKLNVPINNLTI